MPYPREKNIHSVFEEIAHAFCEAPALALADRTISYGELDRLSDRVAKALQASGVETGSIVAVESARSAETIIAWLGVLKCGAAYLPLDPAYPAEALNFMIADSAPPVLLTQGGGAGFVPAEGTLVLDLKGLLAANDEDARPLPRADVPATAPAYVMYTSGSTGKPKGVVVPHRGVVRLVRDQNYMAFSADEVYLLNSALTFDVCTWEAWGALLNGARLAIVEKPRLTLRDIEEAVVRFDVTSVYLTSALFHHAVDEGIAGLGQLRRLLVGGDVMSPDHTRRALQALPHTEIVNAYGPTEATTYCVCYRIPHRGWGEGSVPIGYPLLHDRSYILGDDLTPVADGEIGQLWTAGDGVAIGYHNRPELTAERFRPDPFSDDGGQMYFTGDLARMRPDGLIECLGRVDRQVKINGMRIELDEVEHAFRRDSRVEDAAAVVEHVGDVDKRLVVFLKLGQGAENQLRDAVMADYRARMPAHLVPHEAAAVAGFPLTRNGKADRQKLLDDLVAARGQVQSVSFDTSLEQTIAGIWSQVLERSDFRADQNFFECGGTSLALLKVHGALEKSLGRSLPVTELFAHPTVAGLAAALSKPETAQAAPRDGALSGAADERAARARAARARQRQSRRS